jgi:GR25 family glycosyltransferase involved in LPS biosynthesis
MGTTIKVVDMLKERLRREEGKKRALTLHKVELESMLMNKIIKAEIVDETNDLPPIYWINLDDSVDRRKAMMDMFSSMRISNAHRVSAVNVKDAKSMWQSGKLVLHPDVGLESIEDKAVIWEKKNQHIYSYREAAALLSHLSAIKQAYEARHDYAMIVEDDARITSTFQDEWRGYVDLAPSGWKILQFANSNGAVVRQGAAITEPFISWQPYHWCARAYLINRSGMKTLMDKAYSSSSSSSAGHQGIWHIDEAPMVVADEVVYGYTGGAYTSTGLWVDGFNLDSTIQVDDNPNSFVMTSYLQSIVGDPAMQIAMKKSPNMSYEESLLC